MTGWPRRLARLISCSSWFSSSNSGAWSPDRKTIDIEELSYSGLEKLAAEPHVPVDVLVQQVAEPAGPAGVAGLRAEGPKPHEIALLHFHPIGVEAVDRLALQDVQAVLHDVGLGERNHRAGFKGDDVDVHVVAQVGRVDES